MKLLAVLQAKKRLVALILFLFASAGSGLAFAFWDTTEATVENEINLGEGAVIAAAKVEPEAGKTLVPVGAFMGSNDVNEVVLEYTVTFNKEGRVQATIDQSSIKIGGLEAFNELVNMQVYVTGEEPADNVPVWTITETFGALVEGSTTITVFVRVFVIEPANSEDFAAAAAALYGKLITFDIEFQALELE